MVDVVWSWRRASRAGLALVTVLLLVTVGWTGAAAQPRAAAAGVQPATVMTRNLYLGADLTPLFAAQTPAELVAAATAVWQQVLASDFPARAEALADEVAEQQPLVIGLQEVSLWRTSDVPGQPAQAVALDFLDVYLDALADEGLAYEPVAVVEAFDGQLTALGPQGLFDVRLTDRDVILVRSDVPRALVEVLDTDSGLFDAALELPLLGQTLRADRGWTSVDLRIRRQTVRIVNTHLEAFDPDEVIREAQARELVAGPLATDLPLIVTGDFNSPAPGGRAYTTLLAAGLTDAWSVGGRGPGATCCQAADLRNPVSVLDTRIDLVLVRGPLRVRRAGLLGEDPADRTASGLWPSDHAGVAAEITVLGR
ncbi:MAG TPA: endonuclease/exonuclease/phosphatase family protein [Egibacteraceae bacterium]